MTTQLSILLQVSCGSNRSPRIHSVLLSRKRPSSFGPQTVLWSAGVRCTKLRTSSRRSFGRGAAGVGGRVAVTPTEDRSKSTSNLTCDTDACRGVLLPSFGWQLQVWRFTSRRDADQVWGHTWYRRCMAVNPTPQSPGQEVGSSCAKMPMVEALQ